MNKLAAIYPGTFDPITFGHLDMVKRASKMFDRLVLAILINPQKRFMFTLEERVEMAKKVASKFDNVEVDFFDGLLVDYAKRMNIGIIVRGVRAFSDFEYEFQMALTNRKMAPEIETLFMMPQETFSYISSSLVRDIASLGGDTSSFVPSFVQHALKKKYESNKKQS
ncbi:MAG: pantetheine-phosphate adenylyltransferase [Lentisphaerae bacterium]|nr:pantetheine-phosphate adenylyltransferase [Lentisphaerota bacterium]